MSGWELHCMGWAWDGIAVAFFCLSVCLAVSSTYLTSVV